MIEFITIPINKLAGLSGFLMLIICILLVEYTRKVGIDKNMDMDNTTISHIAEQGTPKKVFVSGALATSVLNLVFAYGIIQEFDSAYTIVIEGYSFFLSLFMILMTITLGSTIKNLHLKFASFFFGSLLITQIAISIIVYNHIAVLSITGLILTLSAIPLTYLAVKSIQKKKKGDINGVLELAFIGPQLLWILLFATYLVV